MFKRITFFFVFALLALQTASGGNLSLLEKYEKNTGIFNEYEIGDKIVFFSQRMIDQAIVEKDFILYQFDRNSKELVFKKTEWRSDLPAHLPVIIPSVKAEETCEGDIEFSELYYISRSSDVFPLNPAPVNPCWIVRSSVGFDQIVSIIDAVNGRFLGYGIVPPYTAFSFSGPQYFYPCSGTWTSWYQDAESWFNSMGYSTEAIEWPVETKVKGHIQSNTTAMFYELAHGGSTDFVSGCLGGSNPDYTTSSDIKSWIAGYEKMPFTFLGSCDGMCSTGSGTFSYEFRKGSSSKTTTVGYCGMSLSQCSTCWVYSISWQRALFDYMSKGYTVKAAFDHANSSYPTCYQNSCMRFAGDESFKVVPVVQRKPGDYIIDNADANFKIMSGTWGSKNHANAYGGSARYNEPGTGTEKAGWQSDTFLPAGRYNVYVWKFQHENSSLMATNAGYMVYHKSGKSNWIRVNQSTSGNEWILLGTFDFDSSRTQGILITDDANGYVIADAVKFTFVSESK